MSVMAAVSSCRYTFDLTGLSDKGKIYMVCIPGGSDTTIFELKYTVPLAGSGAKPASVENAAVSFSVNGSPEKLLLSDGSDPRIPEGSFYTLRKFSAGDVLDLSASAEGIDDISAETVVPDRFPDVQTEIGLETEYNSFGQYDALALKVSFRDDPASEDFYGIMVQGQVYYVRNFDTAQEDFPAADYCYFPYVFTDDTQDISSEKPELRVNYTGGNRLNEDSSDPEMLLFNDGSFNGRIVEMSVNINYSQDFRYTMNTGTVECRSRYRFILFKLSPEFYDSIKAWYNRSYNLPYVEYVMSSPSFVYTNIRGGLGFFGAVNVSVSEWMDNPGDMKDMGPYSESM